MKMSLEAMCFSVAALAIAVPLSTTLPASSFAQTQPPAALAAALPETTIKALQEALNRQGFGVRADGVLNEETRAAIRKYQTQHHLPVTGEPDTATLAKIGVAVQSGAPEGPPAQRQTATTGASPSMMGPQMMQGGMMSGGMMNCPMMQGQARSDAMPMQQGAMNAEMMQGMMQMIKGMMQVVQSQMQPAQPPTAQEPTSR